jgi:hypothetical protein
VKQEEAKRQQEEEANGSREKESNSKRKIEGRRAAYTGDSPPDLGRQSDLIKKMNRRRRGRPSTTYCNKRVCMILCL